MGGRRREEQAQRLGSRACRRARDSPNSSSGCLGQRSGPGVERGSLSLTSPKGIPCTSRFSRQSQPTEFSDPTELLSLWACLEGERAGMARASGAVSLLAPLESCTSSRMDSPLLPLANLALGPSPTGPQTQESSLLWFRPHSLLCGSCFAQSLGLGGGEEWGALPFQDLRLTRLQKVPFLTKSPPFSTGYG